MSEQALQRMGEIYQSRFIGLKDLEEVGRPLTFEIQDVETEELSTIMLGSRKIEGKEKGILIFKRPAGKKNELILNKTSFRNLKAEWGLDVSKWIGSKVIVAAGKVNGKPAVLVELAPKENLDYPESEVPNE